SASAQRCLRPFGATTDIATPNLTSSACEIVPMRAVLWHACLRKTRWKGGVLTGIYRPPGIAGPEGDGRSPGYRGQEFVADRECQLRLTTATGDVPRTGSAADIGPVRVCA